MPAGLLSASPKSTQINAVVSGSKLTQYFTNAHPDYFDSAYVGSKDRQTNFGYYGYAINVTTPVSYNWNYNQTGVQTFVVNTNHSKWKFYSDSYKTTDWTVEIWDSYNTTKLGDYNVSSLWDDGVTIRVKPNSNNSGGANRICTLYCGTYNDYNVYGGTWQGIQYYNGGGTTAPYIYGSCADGTFTLSYFSCTLAVGDTSVYFAYTPAGFAGSNYPIYWYIYRGSNLIGSGTVTGNYNGTTKTKTLTMNEGALANPTVYNIIGYSSNQ